MGIKYTAKRNWDSGLWYIECQGGGYNYIHSKDLPELKAVGLAFSLNQQIRQLNSVVATKEEKCL